MGIFKWAVEVLLLENRVELERNLIVVDLRRIENIRAGHGGGRGLTHLLSVNLQLIGIMVLMFCEF